ncbi:MAG TPA: FHA domain-containing protein, partial [Gemmatimonadaceae bacterium]
MAWLAFGTTTHELHDGDVSVGSGSEAAWRVSTADLMPRHFVVSTSGATATLHAHSPDNVVVVNGTQITRSGHALRDGDVVL